MDVNLISHERAPRRLGRPWPPPSSLSPPLPPPLDGRNGGTGNGGVARVLSDVVPVCPEVTNWFRSTEDGTGAHLWIFLAVSSGATYPAPNSASEGLKRAATRPPNIDFPVRVSRHHEMGVLLLAAVRPFAVRPPRFSPFPCFIRHRGHPAARATLPRRSPPRASLDEDPPSSRVNNRRAELTSKEHDLDVGAVPCAHGTGRSNGCLSK